jgi:WD40 repeat protein
MGFPVIGAGNIQDLKPAFSLSSVRRQAFVVSPDQQFILIASEQGIQVFNRQGGQVAHLPDLRLFDIPCQSCLSVNADASMLALLARAELGWQVQVYNIVNDAPSLYKTFDIEQDFRYAANPAHVALSPDGSLLAYGPGDRPFVVVDLFTGEQLFRSSTAIDSLAFSPAGTLLTARRGRELLVWKTDNLGAGFQNLLLPSENSPIAISTDDAKLALGLSSRLRIYSTERLRIEREFSIRPTYVTDREWQLAFNDETTLRAYGLRWDERTQGGIVTRVEWDTSNPEPQTLEDAETTSQDAQAAFWGILFNDQPLPSGLEPGDYRSIRFVGSETLLVNGISAACWLRLPTGESTCQRRDGEPLHASDAQALQERRETYNTLLVDPNENVLFSLDPNPIYWVNRTADIVLVDIKGTTTDLYGRDRTLPAQSVPGMFRSAAENARSLVFLTRQRTELMFMTLVEKDSLRAIFQKRETRLFKPLAMALDGGIYFLREDRDRNQAILKYIPPGTDNVIDLMRIDLQAEPQAMSVSPQNTLAIGMQDGSVAVVSLDALAYDYFQALQTPVGALAFSPDGRYLAVGGRQGIQVFTVRP